MNDSSNATGLPGVTPSRRGLLATVAALATISATKAASASPVAIGEAGAPHTDAELIRMCDALLAFSAETDLLCDEQEALPFSCPARHALEQAIATRVHGPGGHHDQRAAIAMTPAKTIDGFRAKATLVRMWNYDGDGYQDRFSDMAVASSLANDLLGLPTVWRDEQENGDEMLATGDEA